MWRHRPPAEERNHEAWHRRLLACEMSEVPPVHLFHHCQLVRAVNSFRRLRRIAGKRKQAESRWLCSGNRLRAGGGIVTENGKKQDRRKSAAVWRIRGWSRGSVTKNRDLGLYSGSDSRPARAPSPSPEPRVPSPEPRVPSPGPEPRVPSPESRDWQLSTE